MKTYEEKSPGLAVVLSLFFTGAGLIYLGMNERGAKQLIAYFIFSVLTMLTGGVFAIILLPYWIWGLVDAEKQATAMNARSACHELEVKELAKNTISASDFVGQLEKLTKLYSAGVLTIEELTAKKKALIDELITRKPREEVEDFLAALIPSIERESFKPDEIIAIKKMVM